MSYILKLTDGTNEIDFMSSLYKVADGGLVFGPPEAIETWEETSTSKLGARLTAASFGNREIGITFQVSNSNRDQLLSAVTAVSSMLAAARKRSITQQGPRVLLEFRIDGASESTFHEVITGVLTWPSNVLSVEQVLQRDAAGNWVICDFELSLKVYPYAFTGSSLISAARKLTMVQHGPSGDGNPSESVTLSNSADFEYAKIYGGTYPSRAIPGDMPMKTNVTFTRELGSTSHAATFILGVGRDDVTRAFDDAGSYPVAGITKTQVVTNSDDYGGSYSNYVYAKPGGGTITAGTEIVMAKWGMSDDKYSPLNGGGARFIMRVNNLFFVSPNYNYCLRLVTEDDYGQPTTLFQTQWATPPQDLTPVGYYYLDLGTILFPAFPPALSPLRQASARILYLYVVVRPKVDFPSGNAYLNNFDCIYCVPQTYGYRVVSCTSGNLLVGYALRDNGVEEVVTTYKPFEITGSNEHQAFDALGLMPQITLPAGQSVAVYGLMISADNHINVQDEMSLSIEGLTTVTNGI